DVLHPDCEAVLGVLAPGFDTMDVQPHISRRPSVGWVMRCQRIGNFRSTLCEVAIKARDRLGRLLGAGSATLRTRTGHFIRVRTQDMRVRLRLTALGRRAVAQRTHGEWVVAVRSYIKLPGVAASGAIRTFRI